MEVFSLEFLAILFIAIFILSFWARKKRQGPIIVRGKQISIRGQRISAVLSRDTPLSCLLDDDKAFGEDF